MIKQLSLAELQALRAGRPDLILLEALPEKYFRDWHLPGAIHLPHDRVSELAAALLPNRTAEIVAYCASATCQNSHIAARELTRLGYQNVAFMVDGFTAWSAFGLPVIGQPL